MTIQETKKRYEEKFNDFIQDNNVEAVKTLIKFNKIDSSKSEFLIHAACFGRCEIIKILLENPKIDPSYSNNYAIVAANAEEDYTDAVKLLWEDKRVYNTLKKDDYELYTQLNKKYIQHQIREF